MHLPVGRRQLAVCRRLGKQCVTVPVEPGFHGAAEVDVTEMRRAMRRSHLSWKRTPSRLSLVTTWSMRLVFQASTMLFGRPEVVLGSALVGRKRLPAGADRTQAGDGRR